MSLRIDQLFKFSKLAKVQQKLLDTVHVLTEKVIEEKWKDVEEKQKRKTQDDQFETGKLNADNDTNSTENYTKLHYVRDDLDDIDESDVGNKKRLTFLEMLMDMKKNNGQMSDKEIWEEVNTIMFEV